MDTKVELIELIEHQHHMLISYCSCCRRSKEPLPPCFISVFKKCLSSREPVTGQPVFCSIINRSQVTDDKQTKWKFGKSEDRKTKVKCDTMFVRKVEWRDRRAKGI